MADNFEISHIVSLDPILRNNFLGCYAQDSLPFIARSINENYNKFAIVNTKPQGNIGEHWLLIACRHGVVYLYDSFGREFETNFPTIFEKIENSVTQNVEIVQFHPSHGSLQSMDTQLCGLYCIFMAHHIYASKKSVQNNEIVFWYPPYATEQDIVRFVADNFGDVFPNLYRLF